MIRNFFSWNNQFLKKLKQLTGFTPSNLHLYHTAFRHSSISENMYDSNERLEFLGDAILGAVIASYLYKKFPYKNEGYLTDIRSKMVSRSQLSTIANKMGIEQLINLNGADSLLSKKSLAGNALESLVGAVFIDKGFQTAQQFILKKIVTPYLDIEDIEISEFNYKSKLLEWSQKAGKSLTFTLKHHTRSHHHTLYKIAAMIDGKEYGTGEDTNKKKAEKQAAKHAFEVLQLSVETFMQRSE
ncbi:MAG TPA: ribonuclease III [Chitinophagales bacterium]|nr:ribonuclease III [Chitinophagales bacterium]